MLADPLAAAHCPRVSRVLELCPPRGCRPWGPGDMTEIHRQIGAHSMNYVTAVVAFVGNEIAAGRAEPKVWSHLWRFDGQPFERWAQRYAEEGVKPAAAQELSAAELVEEDARRAGMSEAAVRELVAKVSEGAKC